MSIDISLMDLNSAGFSSHFHAMASKKNILQVPQHAIFKSMGKKQKLLILFYF
jgi:hypothetical protein